MRRRALLGTLLVLVATENSAPAFAGVDSPTGHDPSSVRTARNVLYVELLGNGGFFSLNAERFVSNDFSGRVGLAFFPVISIDAGGGGLATIVPLLVNYSGIGSLNHKLELGVGADLIFPYGKVAATGTIGYRYLPPNGGFAFKIAFTPLLGLGARGFFLPWGGIGFGGAF